MNDEIKEKLDNLRIYAGREENGFISDIEDYITNLQEKFNDVVNKYEELITKYSKLQEENKHLDEVNCKLRKNINNNIYKSRIDKAIEYIGKPLDNYWEEEAQYLLNILNGDKDE